MATSVSRLKSVRSGIVASLTLLTTAMLLAVPVAAAPLVTDCPLRDAPFSASSPLIDVMLSPAARAIVGKTAPGRLDSLPASFAGTTTPSFAAILSFREAGRYLGLTEIKLAEIDANLRQLPVTADDRRVRCARYDNDRLVLTKAPGSPRVLLFDKINGFRDVPSVEAARRAFMAMARERGWALVSTDRGGAFTPSTLRRFDVVIWNNVSGDVLTLSQRQAFRRWMERGGAFVGVHGSAGDPSYFWDWYADDLIGARFVGHPIAKQFQDARIVVDDRSHPIARHLPPEWTMRDEWYSFSSSPRLAGAHVIATLDEKSYEPVGLSGQQLRMGDHPIAWTRCIGRGRMFYSALGHRPEIYERPEFIRLYEAGIEWAAVRRQTCNASR